jgi:hypothetical protein
LQLPAGHCLDLSLRVFDIGTVGKKKLHLDASLYTCPPILSAKIRQFACSRQRVSGGLNGPSVGAILSLTQRILADSRSHPAFPHGWP